jgi:BCCT family transporter.
MVISIIIAVMTAIFTLATISGLHKAMQVAANIKIWLSIGFMVLSLFLAAACLF